MHRKEGPSGWRGLKMQGEVLFNEVDLSVTGMFMTDNVASLIFLRQTFYRPCNITFLINFIGVVINLGESSLSLHSRFLLYLMSPGHHYSCLTADGQNC